MSVRRSSFENIALLDAQCLGQLVLSKLARTTQFVQEHFIEQFSGF
jgi:hypothetical protein